MGGGSPFEQYNEDEDWMHVHASSVTASPSEPATSSNQASDLQLMREVDPFHWLEYVQKPTDNKDSSCPAEEVNRQLASVSGLANEAFPFANFRHDDTHNNLARQADQQRNPIFASMFGFSSQHQYCDSTPPFYRSNLLNAQPVAFHLMDVVSDKQDLSFVEKVQVLEAEILKLCNTLAPASAKGKDSVIASINFDALNSHSASVIGFYGDKQFLTRIVQDINLAPPSLVHDMHSNCLRSGLYGCLNGNGKLYLFYWDARHQLVEASRKDVSCNFVRYLIDLCGIVCVCLDGKTMEEASTTKANILSTQQKRTQRLQVSMRKESENDLKLLKGFNIDLNGNMCCDPFMVRLPQGLHRCLVLGASLNVPKVVSRKDSKTETPANLRAWVESQVNGFYLDCCQLNDKDFLLLLKVLDKQEELQKYSQAEDVWKNKQLEVDEKLQHLDLAVKDKKMKLLSAFRSAMEYILLKKHPWEESLLATADSCGQTQTQLVQASQLNPDCSHLKHEAMLCSLWSDRNDSTQRFLYPGSQVKISCVEKDGEHSAAPDMVFMIGMKCTQTGKMIDSHKMVDGPICFRQQFMLTSKFTDSHADFKQECIAFFSQAEGTVSSDYEPVILNGETKLILNVTAGKKGGELVMVRHARGEDMGLITWLTAFYNGPMSLYQNAAALSHLISKMDRQQLDDKLLEKLLKEPLKKWLEMNCLTPEASSVLIEFLAEKQNESISIQEDVSLICASTYKDARLKSFMAVEAFVNNEICPAVRQHLHKQLQQQKEAMRAANGIEAKALLSNMKAHLFSLDENSSKKTEQTCKLSLLRLQSQSKSVLQSIQYVFTRTDKLTISYLYQELEAETLTWHAVEMVPKKDDLDDLMSNPSSGRIVVPVCSKPTELITLNPKLESLSAVVMVKSGHVLLFVELVDKSCLHLYYYPQLGGSHMGSNPSRTFKRGCDLWAFDEISRFLALYDRKYGSIKTYRFDEAYHHMEWTGSDIQLSKFSGSSNIVWMELVPGKREILLGDDENRLRICELASSMMRARHITLPEPIRKACVTPDASCLIVFSSSTNSHSSQMDQNEAYNDHSNPEFSQILAHVYLLDDTLAFLKCLPIDSLSGQDMEGLHAVCKYYGTQMQLVFVSSRTNGVSLMSYVIEISSAHQTFQLQKVGSQQYSSQKTHDSEQNSSTPALDYLFHVFDKYAVGPPLCSAEREYGFCVLLHPPCYNWNDHRAKKNCEDLIALSLRKLKKKGKAFNSQKMCVSVETLQNSFYLEQSLTAKNTSEVRLGGWMQKLLCLVPLQIARAENNTLKPMINGLQIPSDATFSDAVSLASLLRFGPYDIILAGWRKHVKVISSMGKQSSGKSYLLNHLSGSLLDVAGGRCTDGVWMTVRCESDCLYVLLDFEGLGSFERSEQEDMFLSILNAAISNITLFNKKDFHMDKETEATFQRFQDGVSLVRADEKLFKGLFYMAIKDVDAADVEDLKSEFFTKISYICGKSNDNFLVSMYNGQLCVAALPPFQRPEFQESIGEIGITIQEINATHNSGRCFMEDFKLVLSQISARDWSSVDSKRVAMRLTVLQNHLESAIRLGQCSDGQCLLDFSKDENIADEPIAVDGKDAASLIQDAGLELAGVENDSSRVQVILQSLKQMFESIVQHHDAINKRWHGMYQSFLDSLMERRQTRVLKWLEVNTLEFKEDTDMQKLVLEAATKLLDMRHKIQLCTCKCTKCFLLCLLPKGHSSDHSCLGSHSCMEECLYCLEEAEVSGHMVLQCNDLAGHNGSHDCKKRTHTCEEPCIFAGCASNCNQTCSLRVNHLGDHRCNSIQHMCKEKCALHGCHNACIVPFELGKHDRHGCHEKVCPMQCSMTGCTRTCVTQDHFHDLEAGAQHFCAHEHPCPSKCESPGVCYVHTELLRQTRSFHGQRSDFEYDYVSEQSEDRKGCCLMVPPFMRSHKGSHIHSTNVKVLHYCNVRCPACDYYCHLPFGHAGLHKTVHGNMRKMRFVAEVVEIDVQDRKYVRGESGVAEMCMMHCKARGRGHTHLAPCPEKEGNGCCTEKLYDGARHLKNTKCEGLDVEKPLDELTHETYWEFIRFVDPCEKAEKQSFALCNHLCRSDEHNTENSISGKSYCTEKLWHAPVPRAGAFQTGAGGYVTEDGHHFTCNHSKMSPHNVIFVMDKSGSMASCDILPTMAMFQQSGHSNRLGCIYEAVLRFIRTRMQTTVTSGLQIEDCISVVLFDTAGYVSVKLAPISEGIINQLLHYSAFGGTTYSSGLQMAEKILSESSRQPDLDKKGPMIIFLSDGGNNGGTDPVYMVQKLKQQEPRLVLHTIMFGKDPNARILQDMARVGDGTYQLSLDEVQLARSFEGLARSLQPKLAALCSST